MAPFLKVLTTSYILYPLLGLLLIGLGAIVAKKNKMLGNKQLIIYFVLAVIALVIPAFMGFLDYDFMPYGYIVLVILYFILGTYNMGIISWVFKKQRGFEFTYKYEIIITSLLLIVSMLFFAVVFNLCNELKYGIWASTCMLPFVVVSVFMQTYRQFISIPLPIYEIWKYDQTEYPDEYFDPSGLQVLQIEIYKQENDSEPTKLNVKAPDEMLFGAWFRRMIDDYNVKSPKSPIDNYVQQENGGWMFYVKPTIFSLRRYIDFNKSVRENRIRNKHIVVAKRVKEQT